VPRVFSMCSLPWRLRVSQREVLWRLEGRRLAASWRQFVETYIEEDELCAPKTA
jgi:hypothetical protein